MDQLNLVKQLAINALFWVGIVAIVLSLLAGSLYFLVFFVGLIVFNLVVVNLISKAQPSALNEIPSLGGATNAPTRNAANDSGVLGFRLIPVAYPKVMDSELRDFAPEFISVNIEQNGNAIFSGNFARDALKQFRDGINQVLNVKSVPTLAVPVRTEAHALPHPIPEKPQEQVMEKEVTSPPADVKKVIKHKKSKK